MQAPLVTRLTSDTPGGLSTQKTLSRVVHLSDPNDLLSIVDIIDTFESQWSSVNFCIRCRNTNDYTTSPEGRQSVRTQIDGFGRKTSIQFEDWLPTVFSYNSLGLPETVTRGPVRTHGQQDVCLRYKSTLEFSN